MGSYLATDPNLLLTTAGVLLGLLTGGKVEGGGAQVGLRIPLDDPSTPVEVGINPIVHMSSPNLHAVGLGGITLGGTTVADDGSKLPWGTTFNQRALRGREFWRAVTDYEYGHVPGWNHFGLEYLLKSQAEPFKYDPLTYFVPEELRTAGRDANQADLVPLHYALKLVLGGIQDGKGN